MSYNANPNHKDWKDMSKEEEKEFYRDFQRNWRSWGSWFSWGSPVGLGIWFVLMCASFWIVMQAIH